MISIILPTYNEEGNLPSMYKRLSSAASVMRKYDFEFIFIDDCSQDETPEILTELRSSDDRVVIIRFARNCGSHAAVVAGLNFCRGNLAIVLAADLQDPPEVIIPRMIEQWKNGYKIVWGTPKKRKGEKYATLFFSRLYYFLMNHLTDIDQPPTGAAIVLLDRIVIDEFKQSPEKNTSVLMLIAWLGFSQTSISYVKEARHAGSSKWTFSKRLRLFFDSLISFSYAPLRVMSGMGVISALLGFLYGVVVFINAIMGNPIQGWSSLMIVVLLLGGFQMTMIGIIGEYLWRTYDETRGRPRYVIEKNTLVDCKSGIKRDNQKIEPVI